MMVSLANYKMCRNSSHFVIRQGHVSKAFGIPLNIRILFVAIWVLTRNRRVPGVMEPTLEFLKLFIDWGQNALHGSECWITGGCGVKNQNESCQISSDCNQLIDVIDQDWNQSRRRLVGRLVMTYVV
jgi:hypothetical protein